MDVHTRVKVTLPFVFGRTLVQLFTIVDLGSNKLAGP